MDHNAIEITAIIAVFGMPVLVVLIVMLFISRQKRDKYRLMEAMVKNGQPVPESLLKPDNTPDEPAIKMLRNGLIYIAVGIGLAIALWCFGEIQAVGVASIPVLVGLAYIIAYYVAGSKEKQNADSNKSGI